VVASALVELDGYAPGNGYRAEAARIVAALSSDAYLAAPGEVGGFLLKHSTGNAPAGHEIDVPLAYADYYYLEALTRLNKQRMEP
ncbi:MAG: glucuronyl hydrolase, partial [Kiritimatiellae bacterium]|nr:glucuronyl hydrolase [Kiritimatiellia bacterium]